MGRERETDKMKRQSDEMKRKRYVKKKESAPDRPLCSDWCSFPPDIWGESRVESIAMYKIWIRIVEMDFPP